MPTYGSTNVGGASIEKGLPIGNVSNLVAKVGNEQIKLIWTDPEDLIIGDQKAAEWKGTKVVYKKNSYPVNENDGVLAVDVQTRNQYNENPFIINGLINGDTYYIKLFPYTKTGLVTNDEANQVQATPQAYVIYGVKRLIDNPDTAWERTDDSIGLSSSDFNNIYPYKDIITVDISADGTINSKLGDSNFSFTNPIGYIMTYFPEFWYKRWQTNGYEYIQISDAEQDGFEHSEAFYIGRYLLGKHTSQPPSKLICCSRATITHEANIVTHANGINDFRSLIRNTIGAGWGLMDIWRYSMLQILFLVEYANYNSKNVLNAKNVIYSNMYETTGETDYAGMSSGGNRVIYHGVEDIFGTMWQWVDGINSYNGDIYVCKDRSRYAFNKYTEPYKKLSYKFNNSMYTKKVGYDGNFSELQLPNEGEGSSSTYVSDYSEYNSASYSIAVGQERSPNSSSGINKIGFWGIRTMGDSSGQDGTQTIAVRLLYIPESNL